MGISGDGFAILDSSSMLCLALASNSSTSVVAGAGDFAGTIDMIVVVVVDSVCDAAASVDFSGLGAGAAEASRGCYEPRIEDFLHVTEQ
jgi:hypothetical protein